MTARDQGSTIPLILGFVLICLLMVAGSVAAGDAFVQQDNLQNICDGAAVQAAGSVDLDGQRLDSSAKTALPLHDVQTSVRAYLDRDPDRADIAIAASLSPDLTVVTVDCQRRTRIAFGSYFGLGEGINHHVRSSARAPVAG